MDEAAGDRASATTKAVAQVVYSSRSLAHIERALQFLREKNPGAARDAVTAIQTAVDNLAAHPLIGRRIEGQVRELAISYGQTGYVALYRFVVPQDEIRILAIRHQRELGFQP
ncbi:MAG TPA: type II toxin-antitoxin system RelE/ParE family toxin [Steroidobacteraceae bacterium]